MADMIVEPARGGTILKSFHAFRVALSSPNVSIGNPDRGTRSELAGMTRVWRALTTNFNTCASRNGEALVAIPQQFLLPFFKGRIKEGSFQ